VRENAIASGAPPDASGRPTNKAAVDWLLMGADEGTGDMTWEQIEEGVAKLRGKGGAIFKTAASRKHKSEGGLRTAKANKATWLVVAQDDSHSHACVLPECRLFCTPECRPSQTSSTKTIGALRHSCRVAQKQIYGRKKHMCRKCHRTATQCTAAVCTYIACSRLQKFCKHLHVQEENV